MKNSEHFSEVEKLYQRYKLREIDDDEFCKLYSNIPKEKNNNVEGALNYIMALQEIIRNPDLRYRVLGIDTTKFRNERTGESSDISKSGPSIGYCDLTHH